MNAPTQRTVLPSNAPLTHAMSVDVEDYFQTNVLASVAAPDSWTFWPSRVVDNTRRVFSLFAEHRTRATFFFLGWVAEHFPSLVREAEDLGHEVACHSYWHRPIGSITPKEFREDTRRAKDALQQACGARVTGYRAPTWSITKQSLWALDILAEEGFEYDSSIYPIRHVEYGIANAPRAPYRYECRNGLSIVELPPASVRFCRINMPFGGGAYLRILPFVYTRSAIWWLEVLERRAVVLYLHPWELDPDQPRIANRLNAKVRQYTNLRKTDERVRYLLSRHSFCSMREYLRMHLDESAFSTLAA
jgi:polysaccharide deacetylase family protein (PEP-CTERM system associated)